MEFDAFGFFISILNFGVMFALFYHVVITPMEEAVVVRRKKVTSRLDEIRGTLAAAEKLEAEVKSQYSKLEAEKAEMRRRYLEGNYGYGHAKQELLRLILDKYAEERKVQAHYMNHTDELEHKLLQGAEKARAIASRVLTRVRDKLGYGAVRRH